MAYVFCSLTVDCLEDIKSLNVWELHQEVLYMDHPGFHEQGKVKIFFGVRQGEDAGFR